MVAIGIDLDNKFQSSDQIIELLNGEIEKWRKNLVLCNAINSIDDLLSHANSTKDDKNITTAVKKAIPTDKITTEIDIKIFELSKLIDENTDCVNSKSDQFQ